MFKVITRDVDCSTRRTYKTRAAAVARFESMLGYSMAAALDEMYYNGLPPALNANTAKRVRGVSSFGTVVVFEEVEA